MVIHVTLSLEILNREVHISIFSKMYLLIYIQSTCFTPRVINVQYKSILHLSTGHLYACMFTKYFAKNRFSVSVHLWKISAKSKNDKCIKSHIFAFLN